MYSVYSALQRRLPANELAVSVDISIGIQDVEKIGSAATKDSFLLSTNRISPLIIN